MENFPKLWNWTRNAFQINLTTVQPVLPGLLIDKMGNSFFKKKLSHHNLHWQYDFQYTPMYKEEWIYTKFNTYTFIFSSMTVNWIALFRSTSTLGFMHTYLLANKFYIHDVGELDPTRPRDMLGLCPAQLNSYILPNPSQIYKVPQKCVTFPVILWRAHASVNLWAGSNSH